jgi:hypothetical protein
MPHAQFVEQVAGLALSQEPLKTSHLSAGGIASLLKVLEDRGGTPRADTDTRQGRFVGAHSQAVLLRAKFRMIRSADPAARDPRRYLIRSGRLARETAESPGRASRRLAEPLRARI